MNTLQRIPFRKNIGIKILAILLAVFLWLNVAMEKDYVATFTMPIELVNMPDDLMPSEAFPDKARVRVSGTGKQLIGLRLLSLPKVMVDIFRARAGKRTVVINNADVFLSGADVRVVSIDEPQSIEINFDQVREKKVWVANQATFEERKGHVFVGANTVAPAQVMVKGPSVNVARVETVYTEAVAIPGLDKDTIVPVRLKSPDGFNVSCSPPMVSVLVKVQKLVSRQLRYIPVHLVNAPPVEQVTLDSHSIAMKIVGGEKIVGNFTPNDLNVFVDYRKLIADPQGRLPPTIVKFKEVRLEEISPRTFGLKKIPAPLPSPEAESIPPGGAS